MMFCKQSTNFPCLSKIFDVDFVSARIDVWPGAATSRYQCELAAGVGVGVGVEIAWPRDKFEPRLVW